MAGTDVEKGVHIVQYPREVSLCAGCGGCEIVCSFEHFGAVGKHTARLFVDRGTIDMMHTVYACQQCADHPCYDACPPKVQAMQIDEDGMVWIDQDVCIGCRSCIRACPFTPARINYNWEVKKSQKCDLCRGREGGPACIEYCQVRCIGLSDGPVPVPPPPPAPPG
ncbi:MAG: 4Fe-4S dicluster domain-containing protein [Coriobacteriales bacterium]|jgi:Fe-S-cluster-containing hydrogenase component 2|nr:4Fe-4S dicluster domain-containing protein [Coriobacteriales bacterium]